MPHRGSSSSPEVRHKHRRKHKHKSRSRSRSPHRRHRHKEGRHHRSSEDSGGFDSRHIKKEPDDSDHRDRHRGTGRPRNGQNRRDQEERARHDRKREENHRRRGDTNPFISGPSDDQQFGGPGQNQNTEEPVQENKEGPNFGLSGKLTEDTNTYKGVVIKYNQPPEARKPKRKWRLYPFKDGEVLPVLHIHRESAYLIGRERKIVDIPTDHPSCSKQHAVLQFRLVEYEREDGNRGRRVRPYIIDLGSTNGTYINNNRIEPERYVELIEKDMLKFGYSSREYVLLHEKSDVTIDEDEVEDSPPKE